MRFVFPHSHAFRHGRVGVEDDGERGTEALVEFGDGVTVIARWQRTGDTLTLDIPAYRTARGTDVAERVWRLVQRGDGVWRSERD